MKYHSPFERDTIELIKISSVLISGLLLFLSFLYLFTYYSFFEINIFNYISINTIISYSIQSIGVITLIAITGYLILWIYDFLLQKIIKSFNWMYNKFSLSEHIILLILVSFPHLALIGMLFYLFNFYSIDLIFEDRKLNNLAKEAFFLILVTGIYLNISTQKNTFDLNPRTFSLKNLLISITLIASILTVTSAYLNVLYFHQDIEYKYVVGSDLKGNYPDTEFKIIGTTGNHYFLQNPDKNGVLVKQFEDFEELNLRTYREPKSTE